MAPVILLGNTSSQSSVVHSHPVSCARTPPSCRGIYIYIGVQNFRTLRHRPKAYPIGGTPPSGMPTIMSARVTAFKAFLQENQTGLVQRSSAWVKARKHTIGASEIAALTRSSPFDTPASLVRKKLHPPDLSQNVACAWGRLFESFAREYIEWKHNTKVFGHTISLNLAKTHPLYGKVTCSPNGYCQTLDGSIALLEIKCPFTCKIAVNKIPVLYRDQVQTGLALSGELVTKGLFVDCCFRMCSLSQLVMNLNHNSTQHHTSHRTKTPFPQAWGICILESKYKCTPKQASLLNLGTTKALDIFNQALRDISSGEWNELRVRYSRVRVIWDPRTKAEELFVLKQGKAEFHRAPWSGEAYHPVAFFAWKLLDITEIEEAKAPDYLKSLEPAITAFHRNLELEKAREAGELAPTENTLENDIDILEVFLQGRA